MINRATEISTFGLKSQNIPENIEVSYDDDGNLKSVKWLYNTVDRGLYGMAKRRGGVWNRNAGGWTFADPSVTEEMLCAIVKRNPKWPIIGDPRKPFMPLSKFKFSRIVLGDGRAACLVPLPVPFGFPDFDDVHKIYRLSSAGNKKSVALLIGSTAAIDKVEVSMLESGAKCNPTLADNWSFGGGDKAQVKVAGWAIQITFDLSNPLHYLAAPEQKWRWTGQFPFGTQVAIPWDGTVHITMKAWLGFKAKLQALGLEWQGDNPEEDQAVPVAFDPSRVAGWNSPAGNGYLLHPYQKEGALFVASRGMRALIGDEMGVGKTAQAIAAASGANAPRVLILCPASARYVWEEEIRGWDGRGDIQHITSQLDKVDQDARWHIATYDLIVARSETWRLNDEFEEAAFVAAFPHMKGNITKKPGGGYPRKIALDKPLDKIPAFADGKRVTAWSKTMQRLRGELLEQFLGVGKLLAILDEAHRVNNKTAKRTKAIQRIADGEAGLIMLTGTPLRNSEQEAAVLLGILDGNAAKALSKENGYTVQDVKDYLSHLMIRRTKAQVLPDLPEKTRQRIAISDLDPARMDTYHAALNWASDSYYLAIKDGQSLEAARMRMQGGIEKARVALGLAKVHGGAVTDLILEVVENKGCCVVFCSHKEVGAQLKSRLEKEGLRVGLSNGDTPQKARAEIQKSFQEGCLDVFIGGIKSAGEAITLHRADTIVFVELEWTPAWFSQAEGRIHRKGQRNNCHIIQLVARMQEGENLDEMMVDVIGSKTSIIGRVLDEDTSNIFGETLKKKVRQRLLTRRDQKD